MNVERHLASRVATSSSSLRATSTSAIERRALRSLGHIHVGRRVLMRLPPSAFPALDDQLTLMARRTQVLGHALQIQTADIEAAPKASPSRRRGGINGGQPEPYAYAALFGVAMLWGSYAPAIRYIFLTDEWVLQHRRHPSHAWLHAWLHGKHHKVWHLLYWCVRSPGRRPMLPHPTFSCSDTPPPPPPPSSIAPPARL